MKRIQSIGELVAALGAIPASIWRFGGLSRYEPVHVRAVHFSRDKSFAHSLSALPRSNIAIQPCDANVLASCVRDDDDAISFVDLDAVSYDTFVQSSSEEKTTLLLFYRPTFTDAIFQSSPQNATWWQPNQNETIIHLSCSTWVEKVFQ